MIQYGCRDCQKRAFDAAAIIPVRIEWKCGGCRQIVEAEPLHIASRSVPAHRTLRCTGCDRRHFVERPVNNMTYCPVCGTDSVVIEDEIGAVEQPIHKRATRAPSIR